MELVKVQIKEFLGSLNIIISYIITDILKRPRSFKIGVFSIFLVVSFLTILQAGLNITPIIFIKLAENQAGDIDLMITPVAAENDTRTGDVNDNSAVIRAINITDIDMQLSGLAEIAAIVPRWIVPLYISNTEVMNRSYQAIGLIIDSQQERLKGVGRNLKVKDLQRNECWITKNVERLLNISSKFENLYVKM